MKWYWSVCNCILRCPSRKLWYWQSLGERKEPRLSTTCFMANHCLLPCELEILEQTCYLGRSRQAFRRHQTTVFFIPFNDRNFLKLLACSRRACKKASQAECDPSLKDSYQVAQRQFEANAMYQTTKYQMQ
ncbi:hypothetical protein CDAR_305571 [Caerostris darwini]|uniref:Uncharacterized protein n=1 Tax=Caerostris darwini TaxID=1538125 RepID=A0AAV4RLP5_9ARAC|nr:hypothetical protein CDAR_305571 [Caerostris darwini]